MGTLQSQDSVFLEYLQVQASQLPGSPSQLQRHLQSTAQQQRQQPSPHSNTHMTRGSSAAGTTAALQALVAAHRNYAQRQGMLQVQHDRQALQHMSDKSQMEHRLEQLKRASTVLRDVLSHSDTLALRFKDVSSKQTVPVENEFQPQFSALMANAAADNYALQHGRDGLDWALQFSEPPSQWEQHLAPLEAVHGMCSSYQASINKFKSSKLL